MKILIADDEPLARKRLAKLLTQQEVHYEVVAEASDGYTALEAIQAHQPDTLLLDIRMPGLNGIELALKALEDGYQGAIIFVTAYDEHALEAFEANAIDYLLKPASPERLGQALAKAKRLNDLQQQALKEQIESASISVSHRGSVLRIPLKNILYLRAEMKYVEVCHEHGIALTEESLKNLEQRFPDYFLRIHRNALVSPKRIRQLIKGNDGQMQLLLDGSELALDVSRRHLSEVKKRVRS